MSLGCSLLATVCKYDSLALRIFILIDESNGMIWRSLMECPVRAKSSDTAVGCSLCSFFKTFSATRLCCPNRSLNCRFVSPMYCVWRMALHHVDDVSGCAADAMSHLSVFTCREKDVKRGSFFNKETCVTLIAVTTENSRYLRGWPVVYSSDENVRSVRESWTECYYI